VADGFSTDAAATSTHGAGLHAIVFGAVRTDEAGGQLIEMDFFETAGRPYTECRKIEQKKSGLS